MKKIILLILLLLSFGLIAQNNIYEAKKNHLQFGKYKYLKEYETYYYPEGRERGFAEVLVKGNKKQYLGYFIYQLKEDTEMQISEDNPPRPQLENKIIKSSYSLFDYEKEQIIVTTNFYDEKEPKEKEIKTLQQSKTGFFYIKKKQTYFKNGEMKEEKDLPKKIEFVDVNF